MRRSGACAIGLVLALSMWAGSATAQDKFKRAIVDGQPDKAAQIVRAFRRAKQWVAQNPTKAVIAAQAAGYYPPVPVEASANRAVAFGYDRQVDLAQALERAFQDRIDMGHLKTDKSPKELVRLHYRKIE